MIILSLRKSAGLPPNEIAFDRIVAVSCKTLMNHDALGNPPGVAVCVKGLAGAALLEHSVHFFIEQADAAKEFYAQALLRLRRGALADEDVIEAVCHVLEQDRGHSLLQGFEEASQKIALECAALPGKPSKRKAP